MEEEPHNSVGRKGPSRVRTAVGTEPPGALHLQLQGWVLGISLVDTQCIDPGPGKTELGFLAEAEKKEALSTTRGGWG